jgi:hypothetical protein
MPRWTDEDDAHLIHNWCRWCESKDKESSDVLVYRHPGTDLVACLSYVPYDHPEYDDMMCGTCALCDEVTGNCSNDYEWMVYLGSDLGWACLVYRHIEKEDDAYGRTDEEKESDDREEADSEQGSSRDQKVRRCVPSVLVDLQGHGTSEDADAV